MRHTTAVTTRPGARHGVGRHVAACGWTTSPTPPVRKAWPRACSGSAARLGRRLLRRRHPPLVRHPQLRRCRSPHGCYLEVVAALDHPPPTARRSAAPCRARSRGGGGWLAWAWPSTTSRTSSSAWAAGAAGRHRRRPDGFDLRGADRHQRRRPRTRSCRSSPSGSQRRRAPPGAGGSADPPASLEIAGDEPTVDAYLGTSDPPAPRRGRGALALAVRRRHRRRRGHVRHPARRGPHRLNRAPRHGRLIAVHNVMLDWQQGAALTAALAASPRCSRRCTWGGHGRSHRSPARRR